MGNLVTLFRQKNAIFLQRRHENTTEWQKTKAAKIEKFLGFCESKQIKDIHKISQKQYDEFSQNLVLANKTDETIRKYAMTINEFVLRAHLNIKISPARANNRRKKKKLNKIIEILKQNEIEEQKIENIVINIKKIL